jgi:hypothetical protein
MTLAMQSTAKPCSGRLVMVRVDGDDDPVTALSTEFTTDQITFAEATMYLEPINWPTCSDFWCTMTPVRTSLAGNPIYHEVVSTDCNDKAGALFTAETELEFAFIQTANKATAAYDLPTDLGAQYTDIDVDQGSLSVEQLPDGSIKVCSTKRVRFSGPLDGTALAMLSCVTGYATVAEDFVFSCAALKGTAGGTPFKGHQPPGGTMPPKKVSTTTKKADPATMKVGPTTTVPPVTATGTGSASGTPAPELATITQNAVQAIQKCVADTAAAYQASYGKINAGTYTADDWFKDLSTMWSVAVRDASTLASLGVEAAQAVAQSASTKATGKST